ncbi:MAG: GNAT family N-acetyltransferase, partial [Candidatus Bathyarchaeales archaeon]
MERKAKAQERVYMEIRKLTINDYEEMVRLWSRAKLPFKPKGRDSKTATAVQMKANPEFFLGAFENNRLVGTVIISCDLRKGWINRLAVDPDYRYRGIAKVLIAESEKILRKYGIRIFCALIEDYNAISKKLFKECGYIEHRDII